MRFFYQVTQNSVCLFTHIRILAAILAEISSFPRVVYTSNKWSSTRPLFARSRSCFRTFDHFIAHVWLLTTTRVSASNVCFLCLARCRFDRCNRQLGRFPRSDQSFSVLINLFVRHKSSVAPVTLCFSSITFVYSFGVPSTVTKVTLVSCNVRWSSPYLTIRLGPKFSRSE